MAEDRKQQFTRRRSTLIASLRRAHQFVQRYVATRDQLQVRIRIETLDKVWMNLEEVQTELEIMETTDEGMQANNNTRVECETLYIDVKAALQSFLPPVPSTSSSHPTVSTTGLSGIQLPTISLPEFDGDYNQWLAFHDTFDALIHSNTDVPAIQKFYYLRAAVKGEAAQLIESITISSANYTIAWQALVTRYANDYLLKKRHLQALFECPPMKRESAQALHTLVDEFDRHIKALRQLNEPVDQWGSILEHMLCIRLDYVTLQAWEDHASTVENPDYKCLVEFLQRRIRVLESMSVKHHHSHASHSPISQATPSQEQITYRVASYATAEISQRQCYACDDCHPLIQCTTFANMDVYMRLHIIRTNRLCQNCFRYGHLAHTCFSQYSCRECQERHHTLLHAAFNTSDTTHQVPAHNQATFHMSENEIAEPSTTAACYLSIINENQHNVGTQNQHPTTAITRGKIGEKYTEGPKFQFPQHCKTVAAVHSESRKDPSNIEIDQRSNLFTHSPFIKQQVISQPYGRSTHPKLRYRTHRSSQTSTRLATSDCRPEPKNGGGRFPLTPIHQMQYPISQRRFSRINEKRYQWKQPSVAQHRVFGKHHLDTHKATLHHSAVTSNTPCRLDDHQRMQQPFLSPSARLSPR